MADTPPAPRELFDAIHAGDAEFVIRSFKEGPEVFARRGWTTWMSSAASAGMLPLIELLVAAGADVNTPQAVDPTGSPEGVIDIAAGNGHAEVVRWLLDRGAAVNHVVRGRTRCFALVGAAGSGHLEVVKLLVERGAAVNSCWAGLTPLDHAGMFGQAAVFDYLRSIGAKTAAELGEGS